MKRQKPWWGIIALIFTGVIVGLCNIALSAFVTNPLLGEVAHDEVLVSTYTINLFVGWVFYSAWFLARVDEEWKKVADAVARKNHEEFLLEAPKRIASSVRVLYLLISLLVILSFHLFSIGSPIVLLEIQFGVGFLVSLTILVLWDLDNPINGVINVPNIPSEWLKELATHESIDGV